MDFKQAWKAAGNPNPGNTSWSADVGGRPVFTAWRGRDLAFDQAAKRSVFNSLPGDWIERGEGKSYLRRARQAMQNSWVCRLIWLEGKEPWERAVSADFDDRFYAVRFNQVEDDGTIRGDLFTLSAFHGMTTETYNRNA